MDQIVESSGVWVECYNAILLHSNQPFIIKVILHHDSIKYPYLFIANRYGTYCLIPINQLIQVRFNTTIICFHFYGFNDLEVAFIITDVHCVEAFVTQFQVLTKISLNSTDQFAQHNGEFIKMIFTPSSISSILPLASASECPISYVFPFTVETNAKQTWIRRCNILNSQFFMKTENVVFEFLSWNVASTKPNQEAAKEIETALSKQPDILFVALQEIDMSVKSVVSGISHAARSWAGLVKITITKMKLNMIILKHRSIGGLFVLLAIKRGEDEDNISVLHVKQMRLGYLGIGANKGALQFRLKIGESIVSLVGCHLPAHKGNVQTRNEQLKEIMKYCKGDDYTFIMGDLNYRISMTNEECRPLANQCKVKDLLGMDQLNMSKRQDPILSCLKEADICFPPTYKYDKNTSNYDSSSKKRVPSYTDRILYMRSASTLATGLSETLCFETDIIHQIIETKSLSDSAFVRAFENPKPNFPLDPVVVFYHAGECRSSDHRPIHAGFLIKVSYIDEKRSKSFEKIIKMKIEEAEGCTMPRGSASPYESSIISGKKVLVKITNISHRWAHWEIKASTKSVRVSPLSGVSVPGIPTQLEVEALRPSKKRHWIYLRTAFGDFCSFRIKCKKS